MEWNFLRILVVAIAIALYISLFIILIQTIRYQTEEHFRNQVEKLFTVIIVLVMLLFGFLLIVHLSFNIGV